MTRPFTPRQKYRILVTHGAMVLVEGELRPIARVAFGTISETRRYQLARTWGGAVRCACGCGVWAPLGDIEFDHVKEHVSGGPTAIENGAPLRRRPCHAAKTAASAAVTGKVRRVRRKLSVTIGLRENDSSPQARHSHRSWPTRSLGHPFLRRRFDGVVERRT